MADSNGCYADNGLNGHALSRLLVPIIWTKRYRVWWEMFVKTINSAVQNIDTVYFCVVLVLRKYNMRAEIKGGWETTNWFGVAFMDYWWYGNSLSSLSLASSHTWGVSLFSLAYTHACTVGGRHTNQLAQATHRNICIYGACTVCHCVRGQ